MNVGALGDVLAIDEGFEATAASAERKAYDAIKEAPGAAQAGGSRPQQAESAGRDGR